MFMYTKKSYTVYVHDCMYMYMLGAKHGFAQSVDCSAQSVDCTIHSAQSTDLRAIHDLARAYSGSA